MTAPPSQIPSAIVKLKPGREKAILAGHPWIFSGAITSIPDVEPGSFVSVESDSAKFLGCGILNQRCSLALRMIGARKESPSQTLERNLSDALALRTACLSRNTNCMRLVNAEGDWLPGLVIDRYNSALVIQIGCLGMERIKPWLVEKLKSLLRPVCIREKSSGSSRREEGLNNANGIIWGEDLKEVEVLENGIRYFVDLEKGQKTGFFLDQREMRSLVRELSRGKSVLNCFSYSGGFSVAAALGGANKVVSIDSSGGALEYARRNFELNGIQDSEAEFVEADVFDYLAAAKDDFDIVILDPPAFAKSKAHVRKALRGYSSLIALGVSRVKRGGLMLAFSCSYYVDEAAFLAAARRAATESEYKVSIISSHRQAMDHPVCLHHPEGSYLKGLVCQVR